MGVIKSGAVVGGGVVGGGGVTVGGGYGLHKATEETIEKHFENELLPDSGKDDEWKDLETLRREAVAKENEYELGTVGIESTPNGKKLVEWCKKQKKESYGSFLYRDRNYVNKVKNYCIYPIRNKLSKETSIETLKVTDNSSESDFKTNFEKISALSSETTTNGDITKVPNLNYIKSQYKNKDSDWAYLREWCKWALEKGYQGDDRDIYKLAKHLCTKSK